MQFWVDFEIVEEYYTVGIMFSKNPKNYLRSTSWKRKIITCEEFEIAWNVQHTYFNSVPIRTVGGLYWTRPCQKLLMEVCPDFFSLAWKVWDKKL
jgi:hypothetical protein